VMALWNLPPDIDGGHFCRTFQFPNLLLNLQFSHGFPTAVHRLRLCFLAV
jgi:hypothetical protein